MSRTARARLNLMRRGSTLYFIDMVEEGVGVLKAAQLGGSGIKKINTIDEDVGAFYLRDKGDVVYAKDVKNGSGELYSGGKLLLSDVKLSTIAMVEDSNTFFCLCRLQRQQLLGSAAGGFRQSGKGEGRCLRL